MCGIFCALSCTRHVLPSHELQQVLRSRGPDSAHTVLTTYRAEPATTTPKQDVSTRDINLTLCSTVLSLRGTQVITQPYQDESERYTLCWNGEAWSIGGEPAAGNDTEAVHRLLVNAVSTASRNGIGEDSVDSARIIANALSQVAGPYAFVFLDQAHGRLFLGRDFLGRRSLLLKVTDGGDVIISSVSDGTDGWIEIEANGVYCIDLRMTDPCIVLQDSMLYRWGCFMVGLAPYCFADKRRGTKSVIPPLSLNKIPPSVHEPLTEASTSVSRLQTLLYDSLSVRTLNIPEPLLSDDDSLPEKTKLAILFSGGLDCTVLARMSHDVLPHSEPIDLLNIAFENPRIHKSADRLGASIESNAYELCPDRITGRASFDELRRICPERAWRLVVTNIPYADTMAHRSKVISIMQPHNTEMDLSIAFALYFAARGQGLVSNSMDDPPIPYTTSARVLLSGLGADELFGGYTRHGTAYRRGGFPGLLDELELDVSRLGKRNLGRDDRVMSHWSREVRFPYLDEKLLSWALSAPVDEKCGFGEPLPTGSLETNKEDGRTLEPEKKVLRCLAWKLGMKSVAKEKKRAVCPVEQAY